MRVEEMYLIEAEAVGKGKDLTFFFLFRKEFRLCGGDQRAVRTDEVCDRPLETFACTPMLVVCTAACGYGGQCGYPVDKHAGIA